MPQIDKNLCPLKKSTAQSTGVVEYTDFISAEG